MTNTHTLIIGIGNRYRGDDAFGCMVVDDLAGQVPQNVKCVEHDGEPAGLMECWQDADSVILVDAVSSGADAGHVFRIDLARHTLPKEFNLYSTHAFGVPQAIELARALDTLPRDIHFIGVEGENFDAGETLSSSLSNARHRVVADILNSLK